VIDAYLTLSDPRAAVASLCLGGSLFCAATALLQRTPKSTRPQGNRGRHAAQPDPWQRRLPNRWLP
jgi:hypothetical protein